MPRTYVDNAQNRSLGRVGKPVGSAVHSKSSGGGGSASSVATGGSCGNSTRTYVDNPQNRRLGRVGLEHGTAVYSKSGDETKTYVDNPQNRSLGRVGMMHGTAVHSKTESSAKTYVDNPQNRRLGRVGMAHGTAVYSKTGDKTKTYVDNPQNRSLNRVGMMHGTAVHSKTESSAKTYVDNPQNRRLGRVGLEHGTAVYSKTESSTKTYVDNPLNRSLGRVGMMHGTAVQSKTESSTKTYVDNPLNRSLSRVGMMHGTAVQSKTESSTKTYVDNPLNRRLGRAGMAHGTAVYSKDIDYNPINRISGPVGEPWGTGQSCENPQAKLLGKFREEPDADVSSDFADYYSYEKHMNDSVEHAVDLMNREKAVERYPDTKPVDSGWPSHVRTSTDVMKKYNGLKIDFDDLDLICEIGQGGFGVVHMAEWRHEVVAVKKLLFQNVTKKRLHEFEEEIMLYCTLDHPNVVQFIGACVQRQNLAIVMEYMDKSLHDAIHMEHVQFNDVEKITITQHIARGLAYLHSGAIAHCDLKAQNILVNNIRGEEHYNPDMDVLAKITDFGLSKIKSESETWTSVKSKTFFGTPRFSAPEILRGELLELDQLLAADVYSMGLLIFELILETVPFQQMSLIQLRKQVGENGLKPTIPGEVVKEVKNLLKICWLFDPDCRPLAQQVADAVETFTSPLVEEEEE